MSGSRPWRLLAVLFLPAVVLTFYGRALGRYFTSEDFLLIRFLGENPPWRDLSSQLASPWLGMTAIKFYRPVATLFYGLEVASFGGHPVGYHVVHLLVHGANTALIWRIVRRLDREEGTLTPFAAALLFAVYPLHPNAVVFSASFATLVGAAFLLASVLLYQRFRESGSTGAWGGAIACFVCALGSYEAAAVLPALLAAYDHLVAIRMKPGRRHLSLLPGSLPFFGLLGLYLLLRRWIFGVFLGGYDEHGRRLLAPELRQMAVDLATSIHQLHLPLYDRQPAPWMITVSCAAVLGAPLVVWLLRGRSHESGYARLWLFSWAWILVSQVPFAFRPAVPGNGRYWYVAAAGVAMSAVFLARGLFAATRPPWRGLAPAAVGLLACGWGILLYGYVSTYVAAGRTARHIQSELLRAGRASAEIFFTRYPYFLLNEAQTPVAQVYRYGVWDSLQPPFVRERISLYPLPPLAGAELLPVSLAKPASPIYEWEKGSIRRFVPPPATLPEFRVLRPAPGAAVKPGRDFAAVAVPPGEHLRFRLIVVTRINGAVFDLDRGAVQGGVLRARFPEILDTSDRLYGKDEHYWWIEARNAAGLVSGFSRMRGVHRAD